MMTTAADTALFDNRDVGTDGNESEPECEPSDIELEESEVGEQPEDDFEEEEPRYEDEDTIQSGPTNLRDKVKFVMHAFDEVNLKIADFLDAISWGDPACTQDAKIRVERSVLLRDGKLEDILHRWAYPPRQHGSKKRRPQGAYPIMKSFSINFFRDSASTELESLADFLHSSAEDSEDVAMANLLKTGFGGLSDKMQSKAPFLWTLIQSLADRPGARKETGKDKRKVCEYSRGY